MKTIWVTGAAGFIGSHYARLLAKQQDVKVLMLDAYKYSANGDRVADFAKQPNVDAWIVDFSRSEDAFAFMRAIGAPDEIVHFAAETHVDNSIEDPRPFIFSNFVGTYTVLEMVRRSKGKVKKLVHISTDEVLGSAPHAYTPGAPHWPSNVYAATKAGAEDLVNAYHTTWKLPISIVRMVNNYGPWQHEEKAIPTWVKAILHEKPIPLYGQGEHRRCWLHVRDAAKAVELVRTKGRDGKTYHVGSETEVQNSEMVKRITKILDKPDHPIKFIPDEVARPGHDKRYLLDDSDTKQELGWKQEVPFGSGLDETVRWFEEHFTVKVGA
jgi:dTDP-glucose 4,6-dehydratase